MHTCTNVLQHRGNTNMHKNILFIFKEHIVGDHLDAKY